MESSLNNIILAVIISLLLLNLFGINTSSNWFWIIFIIGIIISTIIKSFYWYKRQNYFLKLISKDRDKASKEIRNLQGNNRLTQKLFEVIEKESVKEVNLEIIFNKKNAAVLIETNLLSQKKEYGFILLLSNYILRNLYNLNQNSAMSLVEHLTFLVDNRKNDFKSSVVGHKLEFDVLTEEELDPVKKIASRLTYISPKKTSNFQLNTVGFDENSISYYSISSVKILIKYLAEQNINNSDFLNKIKECIELCIDAYDKSDLGPNREYISTINIANKVFNNNYF